MLCSKISNQFFRENSDYYNKKLIKKLINNQQNIEKKIKIVWKQHHIFSKKGFKQKIVDFGEHSIPDSKLNSNQCSKYKE